MKQFLLMLFAVLGVVSASYSQVKKTVKHVQLKMVNDTSQLIPGINKLTAQIKKESNTYRKIVMDADNTKYKWYFFKGDELKIVEIWSSDENNDMKVKWYFNNKKLIYSEQDWSNVETKQLIQNNKMYLKNEVLLAWISSNKGRIDSASKEFKDVAEGLKGFLANLKASGFK